MRYAIVLVSVLLGCDTLECGEGTHRSGDLCEPNVQVACAEGTELRDGRCVAILPDAGPEVDASDLTCGAGTHREGGECVPDVIPPDPDLGPPEPDDGIPPDMFVDPDDGVELDAAPDMAPDMAPPPPACPEGTEPGEVPVCDPPAGTYCVTGVATNFLTGCALPSDENLLIFLIDPTVVANGRPIEEALRANPAPIGPGGTFTMIGAGAALQLVVTIDENPMVEGPDLWTRSVSGVSAAQAVDGTVYPVRAFATDQATQARWNALLGLGDQGLEQTGFMVGRVLSITAEGPRPVAGAEVDTLPVSDLEACDADAPCMRFFDDDPRLVGLQPAGAGTTGASGAFMLIRQGPVPVFQGAFQVVGDEAYAPVPGGASVGSAFHTALVRTP